MDMVDVTFPLAGETLPLDHGYALYAALCRIIPDLHTYGDVGVHPIRGDAIGGRELRVATRSQLRIRTPVAHIGSLVSLAGKALALDGHQLRIGVPRVFALRPFIWAG